MRHAGKQKPARGGTAGPADCRATQRSNQYASVGQGIKAPNFDTIVADLRAASAHGETEVRKLYRAAFQEFARINDWKISSPFQPENLGRRTRRSFHSNTAIFDHCAHFRSKRRCAAIVAQPYSDCRDEATALAARLDIELHIPPNPRASLWAPGQAFFFVFTERGHAIQWLPEQMVQP